MFWHQQSKRSTSTSRTLKSTPVAPPPLFLRTPKLSLRHMRRKNNFGVLCPPLCGGNLLPPHSRQIGVYFCCLRLIKSQAVSMLFAALSPNRSAAAEQAPENIGFVQVSVGCLPPIRAFAFSTIVRNRSLDWHNHWSVPQKSREHPPEEAA